MRRNKVFDFWFRKQYVIAGCLVLCAGVGMTALYNYNQKQEQARLEQEIAQNSTEQYVAEETQMEDVASVIPPKETVVNQAVEDILQQNESNNGQILAEGDEGAIEDVVVLSEGENVAEDAGNTESSTKVSAAVPSLHFPSEEGMLWPLDGNVIMNYSMNATIYYATLDQYKYNPAIIIAGDVNSKVYSVAQGKIIDISQNEVTGTTVTVDLGDGYQAIYGQLKELNFKVGDMVESGQVIGYVSEPTKYYSVEGPSIYFQILKDKVPMDPEELFTQ